MTAAETAAPPTRWIEGLTAEMPLLDALETIFKQRWHGVLYYLPLAAEHGDEDVEHVHKLRVSSRRLSAALDVLAEGFPEAPRKSLFKLVEKTRRTCGEARDLDVRRKFLETLLPHASMEDAAVIELLCEQVEQRRNKLQKKLRRRLPRLEKRLERAGRELLESLQAMREHGSAGFGSFGQSGVRTLLKELTALWSRAAEEPSDRKSLHQLRIACKHLRYAVEVFLPILGETFRDDFYPQLEHVQDLLGEFHDSAEATRVLKRRRRKWRRARDTARWAHSGLSAFQWPELRSGLDAILLAYAQQADQSRTEFLDLWPGFAGESFRVPVEELLLERLSPAGEASAVEHIDGNGSAEIASGGLPATESSVPLPIASPPLVTGATQPTSRLNDLSSASGEEPGRAP